MTRVERAVVQRQQMLIRRVAAVVRAEFPDLGVEEAAQAVTLSGRALSRRRLADSTLRAIGMLMRERSS